MRHFQVDASCAEDIYHPELRFWTGPDEYDPSAHDAMLRKLSVIRPDALFTLRVYAGAPDWWLEANPAHWQIYADGSNRRRLKSAGIRMVPSLASPRWKNDVNQALERFVGWLIESGWSRRIAGILFATGLLGSGVCSVPMGCRIIRRTRKNIFGNI